MSDSPVGEERQRAGDLEGHLEPSSSPAVAAAVASVSPEGVGTVPLFVAVAKLNARLSVYLCNLIR